MTHGQTIILSLFIFFTINHLFIFCLVQTKNLYAYHYKLAIRLYMVMIM